MSITRKDARDLTFVTREQAVDTVIRLMEERDALLEALQRVKETGVFVGAIAQEMMDAAIAKAEGA
jgi:predicted transcriptional regulator